MSARAWATVALALAVVFGASTAEAQKKKPRHRHRRPVPKAPVKTEAQREAEARAAAAAPEALQRQQEEARALDEERKTLDRLRVESDRAEAENAHVDEALEKEAEDRRSGFVALPNISYAPETAFVLGGYLNYFVHFGDPLLTRPSTFEVAPLATTKSQFVADVRTSLWLLRDALNIRLQVGAETFPNVYFGIGKDTRFDQMEGYTSRDITTEDAVMVRIFPRVYLGAQVSFDTREIVDREADGELAKNSVTGASGGTVLQAGPSLTYDSRDSVFATKSGTFAEIVYRSAIPGVSDFTFGQVSARGKEFIPLGQTVLAMHVEAQFSHGAAPWYLLPAEGGDLLRGVFYGRFRDNNLVQGQAEWRFPIFGRWGGAAFMGAGTIARTLADFNPKDLTPAGGAGLRFMLNKSEGINIRLDVAYSPDGLLQYLNAGEAF